MNAKRRYYVYIMSGATHRLYIGVTNNLARRVWEHKNKLHPGFTAQYNLTWLVYAETFDSILDALDREKQLKGWRRDKKIALIESINPRWADLSLDGLYDE